MTRNVFEVINWDFETEGLEKIIGFSEVLILDLKEKKNEQDSQIL